MDDFWPFGGYSGSFFYYTDQGRYRRGLGRKVDIVLINGWTFCYRRNTLYFAN